MKQSIEKNVVSDGTVKVLSKDQREINTLS